MNKIEQKKKQDQQEWLDAYFEEHFDKVVNLEHWINSQYEGAWADRWAMRTLPILWENGIRKSRAGAFWGNSVDTFYVSKETIWLTHENPDSDEWERVDEMPDDLEYLGENVIFDDLEKEEN